MIDKKIINVLCSLVIIALLIVVLYFAFTKFTNDNNKPKQLTTQDITKIGLEKFELLNSKTDISNNKPIFFKDNDVNINNISNQDILYIAYSLLSQEDKNGSGNVNEYCFDKSLDLFVDDCYKEVFSKNILQEQINNFFSSDIKVTYESFKTSGNLLCNINNDTYTCTLNRNPFFNDYILSVRMFDSAKLNNDNLEIYSHLISIVRRLVNGKEPGIYSDYSSTNKIDDITFFDNNIQDNLNKENYKILINKYKDKATKYKSIFKKVDDNYVWVSTEIVK